MSHSGKGRRGAAAGFALAAAGMLYSRLGGRMQRSQAAPASGDASDESPAPNADVKRARAELADELARRASSSRD